MFPPGPLVDEPEINSIDPPVPSSALPEKIPIRPLSSPGLAFAVKICIFPLVLLSLPPL